MKKSDLPSAFELPHRFETWNPALRGAYLKGARAFFAGESIQACPYQDVRKPSGGLSWSRSFMLAWADGHRGAERQAKSWEASKEVSHVA